MSLLAVAGAMALVGGCGGSVSSGGASGTLASIQSGVVNVTAIDNYFNPEIVTVTVGSKVVWTNLGRNDHNVKSPNGNVISVDTKAFGPGASAMVTLSTPGTYHYYCSIHGTADRGMVGTVQVVPR